MNLDPDVLQVYAAPLAELAPGERVLAAVVTNAPMGLDPPLPPDGGDHPATAGSAAGSVAATILSPPKPGQGFFWWLLFGRSAAGAPTSTAAASRRACLGHHPLMLVVTDTRLRLYEPRDGAYFVDDAGNAAKPATERLLPLWDTPRSAVRSARVGWHRLHRNRLTIEFTDGSWASFASLFQMGRRKASTIVAALNG
ncbi:hypothetical protein AB0K00_06265 [Dactylosporangium sp. NPDC049525]|uniref:hypothetical protein n=1 Tax=Dactylosporangium sp. NPDC049525 TaxID=3154730 RepID=UPI003416F3F4